MIEITNKLEELLTVAIAYISKASEVELRQKASPEKWSKKEITGHLVDSGIYNLQRFIEIQYEKKPHTIRHYNRDESVKVNDYQNSESNELAGLLMSINARIKSVMMLQTPQTLNYSIELYPGELFDLRYLMEDYVVHFEHHINQIIKT